MELINSFLGYRDFASEKEIKKYIKHSKSYSSIEDNDEVNPMLIFETSKQKTWILTTSLRLYCILDDVRKESPVIAWSMSKEEIIENEDLKIKIKARNRKEKKYTGSIDFGKKHKRWLYSKQILGDDTSAATKVKSFLKEKLK